MLEGYLIADTPLGKYPRKAMFRHGFEILWQQLVQVNKLTDRIQLNTSISAITRDPAGVTIKGVDKNKQPFTKKFDHVVLAAPLAEASAYLDQDDEETELFKPLQSFTFRTTLYQRTPEPNRTAHVDLYPDTLTGGAGEVAGVGRVHAIRDSVVATFGDLHGTDKDRREQMCYQFDTRAMETMDAGALDKFLAEQNGYRKQFLDARVGPADIWQTENFRYFYHYSPEFIEKGYPWRILERQGKRRTIYVHASVLFESVLDIIHYETMLLKTLLE